MSRNTREAPPEGPRRGIRAVELRGGGLVRLELLATDQLTMTAEDRAFIATIAELADAFDQQRDKDLG